MTASRARCVDRNGEISPLHLMPLHLSSLRRFVRRALLDTAGVAEPDRAHLATAFDALCQRLRNQLDPLFGTAAVEALFVRSVHVATTDHPWLGELVPQGKDVCAVERVALLDHLEANTLQEGLVTVLAHHIGLLSEFVGEDLVLPLVQEAWGVSRESDNEDDQ